MALMIFQQQKKKMIKPLMDKLSEDKVGLKKMGRSNLKGLL
jgi:hypothetical protein